MIRNKIRILFKEKNKQIKDYAEKIGISQQHLNNRFRSGAFKAKDLIEYAEFTGTQLAFIDKETGKVVVSFDIDDIKKD